MDSTFEYKSMSQKPSRMLVVLIAISSALFGALLTVVALGLHGQSGAASLSSEAWCYSKDFKKMVVKTVMDEPLSALLPEIAEFKFEASGVAIHDHKLFYIGDSSWEIPVFNDLSKKSQLVDAFKPNQESTSDNYFAAPEDQLAFPSTAESGWEAITYDEVNEQFIAVQEALEFKDGLNHALLMALSIKGKKWSLNQACPSEFSFTHDNKGFEGAVFMRGIDNRSFVLGLCEGNFCEGGKRGKMKGNGRLVITELHSGNGPPNSFRDGKFYETSTCVWKTVAVINIPAAASFEDYSDVAIRKDSIVITSQASSSLFIGRMTLEDGKVNPETFAVIGNRVLYFAPTSTCQVQYCNVEAIGFLSDRLLLGGSDAMKSKGKQPFQCLAMDQSVHVFALPYNLHY